MEWIRSHAKFSLTFLGFENALRFDKAVEHINRGETMLCVEWLSKRSSKIGSTAWNSAYTQDVLSTYA